MGQVIRVTINFTPAAAEDERDSYDYAESPPDFGPPVSGAVIVEWP